MFRVYASKQEKSTLVISSGTFSSSVVSRRVSMMRIIVVACLVVYVLGGGALGTIVSDNKIELGYDARCVNRIVYMVLLSTCH